MLKLLSSWVIPLFISFTIIAGYVRRINVYEAFVEGAKGGVATVFRIMPYLVAMFVAIEVFKASGAMDLLMRALAPLLKPLGIPAEVLPLMIMRPLSGSASLGVLGNILSAVGPDSYAGRVASTMMGSTETTFYVMALYLGAVGIKKSRHVLPAALLADMTGFVMAALAVRWLFGQ